MTKITLQKKKKKKINYKLLIIYDFLNLKLKKRIIGNIFAYKFHINFTRQKMEELFLINNEFRNEDLELIRKFLEFRKISSNIKSYDEIKDENIGKSKIITNKLFEEKLREEYAKQYKANNKQHFSNPVELREFYDDGVEIIREFAKKKGKYFSKRGWHLVGCETHIMLPPNENYPNVLFQGYLDVVLYHEPTQTFKIIDIKTASITNGLVDELVKTIITKNKKVNSSVGLIAVVKKLKFLNPYL